MAVTWCECQRCGRAFCGICARLEEDSRCHPCMQPGAVERALLALAAVAAWPGDWLRGRLHDASHAIWRRRFHELYRVVPRDERRADPPH